MPDISVGLTESEVETLSRCADCRDIGSADVYVETLLTQFVAYAESHGTEREVAADVESKLEDLGYL